jgi:hypothetical protein
VASHDVGGPSESSLKEARTQEYLDTTVRVQRAQVTWVTQHLASLAVEVICDEDSLWLVPRNEAASWRRR